MRRSLCDCQPQGSIGSGAEEGPTGTSTSPQRPSGSRHIGEGKTPSLWDDAAGWSSGDQSPGQCAAKDDRAVHVKIPSYRAHVCIRTSTAFMPACSPGTTVIRVST